MNKGTILQKVPLDFLEENLLDENKELKVLPASFYKDIPQTTLSLFCVKYGFYSLPTVELCEWLKEKINGRKVIEIGAGHGAICKYLGIKGTDSRLQEDPLIKLYYQSLQQSVVAYPPHVEKRTAEEVSSTISLKL